MNIFLTFYSIIFMGKIVLLINLKPRIITTIPLSASIVKIRKHIVCARLLCQENKTVEAPNVLPTCIVISEYYEIYDFCVLC